MNNIVILTGVSGAGKTSAALIFEELGFYSTENVPNTLFKELFQEFSKEKIRYKNVFMMTNIADAGEAYRVAKEFKNLNVMFVGLDASFDVLMERYRLTRHIHPLQMKGYTLEEAIKKDHLAILELRNDFTHYLDTSKLTFNEMRQYFHDAIKGKSSQRLNVVFVSFGYKMAVPLDLDFIIDARVLPNPYWEESLRELTGLDKKIQDYVLDNDLSRDYLKRITSLLDKYLEESDKAGRSIINIGIGCSGGQHRSVSVSEYLKNYYKDKYISRSDHRDIPDKK